MRIITFLVIAIPALRLASAGLYHRREAYFTAADDEEGRTCGSAYVAVFSRRDSPERRAQIRKMWQEAGTGWGDVVSQFALCQAPEGETPGVAEALSLEAQQHKDILIMDCEDGYLNGALTKKVAASMRVFLRNYSDRQFFMKTDDDTFARMGAICGLLAWREKHHRPNDRVYLGVFAEGGESMETKHPPCRDDSSEWYEPVEKFAGDYYPKSAKGGPGYLLSRDLVKQITEQDIASSNVLNNEDKAVGVWVDKLIQKGEDVTMLNVKGTDGYDEHKDSTVTSGLYGDYPFFLHHHLSGAAIGCLHEIRMQQQPVMNIDGCFALS